MLQIDVDTLPCLQRLFLSYNEIAALVKKILCKYLVVSIQFCFLHYETAVLWCRFEDISCLSDSRSLLEVSLDGNPLALDPQYRQTILRNMLQLKHFDMKKVTVQCSSS